MSSEGSVSAWLGLLQAGDHQGAARLWERYFQSLVQLARAKLKDAPRRAADEEDVALSAFASFCHGRGANIYHWLHELNVRFGFHAFAAVPSHPTAFVDFQGRESMPRKTINDVTVFPPARTAGFFLCAGRDTIGGIEAGRIIMPPRTKKTPTVTALIDRIVKRIVRKHHPEKIILFGSRARGDAGTDSDVDLLVVMEFDGSKLEKMVEVQGTLDDISLPVDILLTTPKQFAWRKDVVGTIEWPASREGKVLYARD